MSAETVKGVHGRQTKMEKQKLADHHKSFVVTSFCKCQTTGRVDTISSHVKNLSTGIGTYLDRRIMDMAYPHWMWLSDGQKGEIAEDCLNIGKRHAYHKKLKRKRKTHRF